MSYFSDADTREECTLKRSASDENALLDSMQLGAVHRRVTFMETLLRCRRVAPVGLVERNPVELKNGDRTAAAEKEWVVERTEKTRMRVEVKEDDEKENNEEDENNNELFAACGPGSVGWLARNSIEITRFWYEARRLQKRKREGRWRSFWMTFLR